jgi:hypothetical protein
LQDSATSRAQRLLEKVLMKVGAWHIKDESCFENITEQIGDTIESVKDACGLSKLVF